MRNCHETCLGIQSDCLKDALVHGSLCDKQGDGPPRLTLIVRLSGCLTVLAMMPDPTDGSWRRGATISVVIMELDSGIEDAPECWKVFTVPAAEADHTRIACRVCFGKQDGHWLMGFRALDADCATNLVK